MIKVLFFLLLSSLTISAQLKVGDIASDFQLMNTDDKNVSLADYPNAKGFIVVFTCNHCPYAKMYEDRLIDLHKKYAAKGYPVIAINPNDPDVVPEDSPVEMKKRAKSKKFKFPYLFDAKQEVYVKYGATKTPHVFLLDKNRMVKYIGAIDDNPREEKQVKEKFLENAVSSLDMGKDPDPSVTKAIGCSIKKKS